MDSVLILFQRKLHAVISDPAAPSPKPSWAESLKVKTIKDGFIYLIMQIFTVYS